MLLLHAALLTVGTRLLPAAHNSYGLTVTIAIVAAGVITETAEGLHLPPFFQGIAVMYGIGISVFVLLSYAMMLFKRRKLVIAETAAG